MKIMPMMAVCLVMLAAFAGALENISEDDALRALTEAMQDMMDMSEANFGVSYINSTIISASDKMHIKGNTAYGDIVSMLRVVGERKARAYGINDNLRSFELGLEGLKGSEVNYSSSLQLFHKAKKAFEEERYDEAEVVLAGAESDLSAKKEEVTVIRTMSAATRGFLQRYWPHVAVSLAVLIGSGFGLWRLFRIVKAKKELKSLKTEKEVILKLIRETQNERYSEMVLSARSYGIKMEAFKDRLREIDHIIPVLEAIIRRKHDSVAK